MRRNITLISYLLAKSIILPSSIKILPSYVFLLTSKYSAFSHQTSDISHPSAVLQNKQQLIAKLNLGLKNSFLIIMEMIIKKHLSESVEESLAHDMQPIDYKKAVEKNFSSGLTIQPRILTQGDIYHNPPEEEHTSDREAYGKISWIEYWRRLTGFTDNHLKCSFCDADIFIDVDDFDAKTMRMEHPKTSKEKYQAEGGHYHKNRNDNKEGYIVIPVCKECNGRSEDYDLIVTNLNQYVEEVGAIVKK